MSVNKNKVTHINSIAVMDDSTYRKLQKCLGVNFEKERQKQQKDYFKKNFKIYGKV